MGHEVTLITSSFKGAKKHEIIDGVEIFRFGCKYTVYFHAILNYLLRFQKECDVIVDDVNTVPFFTVYYSKQPVVAVFHQIMLKHLLIKEKPRWVTVPLAYIEPHLIKPYRRASCCIAVSEGTKKDLERLGIPSEKITVIHNGIDHNIYKPGSEKRENAIVYIGRLKFYKGVHDLILAFKKVVEKIPSARLRIVGRGDMYYEEYLRNLTENLGLNDHVSFEGFTQEKEKVRILQQSKVLAYPSIREGWGISIIEANACGVPAVGYDAPGLRDSIRHGETGVLVRLGDVEALAEALTSLLKDDMLREKMSRNALEWSKKFSWDDSARRFEEVLKNLVDER